MIPTSVTTVVLFFLLVGPGLLAEHLGTKLTPRAKQTTSRELGLVVLWSTVYTTFGVVAAYWIFRAAGFGWDHLNKAANDETYRADNAPVLIAELVSAVALAMTLVLLVYLVQRKINEGKLIAQQSAWFSVFASDLPVAELPPGPRPRLARWIRKKRFRAVRKVRSWRTTRKVRSWRITQVRSWRITRKIHGAFRARKQRKARRARIVAKSEVTPIVQVNLKSGKSYCGDLRSYDPDLGYSGREIILENPLFEMDADGKYRQMDPSWQRMAFISDEIASMAVQYTLKHLQSADRPALQWHTPLADETKNYPSPAAPTA